MISRYEVACPLDWSKDMYDWATWLADNLPSKDWDLDFSMNYNRIMFRNTEDATAFKLRFGL